MATNSGRLWWESFSRARRFGTSTVLGVSLLCVVPVVVATTAALVQAIEFWPALLVVVSGPVLVFGGATLFYRFKIYWNRPLMEVETPHREGDQWYVSVTNLRRRAVDVLVVLRVGAQGVDPSEEGFPARWSDTNGQLATLAAGERRDFHVVRLETKGSVVARWIQYQSGGGPDEFSCSDWDPSRPATLALLERLARPITIEATVQTVPDSRSGPIRASFELVGTELIKR